MRMRALGESGIEASVVGMGAYALGGWQWGGVRENEAESAVRAALDAGITLIDTAPIYGMGRSEEILGRVLRESGLRPQVILASKCGLAWDGDARGTYAFSSSDASVVPETDASALYRIYKNNRPDQVRRDVESSLRRLRTDYIDLMQTHWQDPTVPIEDTMAELERLKREGKIRAIGCCNATTEDMERYRSIGLLVADQEKCNMLDAAGAAANREYCREKSMAFLASSPLAQGLLTGAAGPERHYAPGDARNGKPRFSIEFRARIQALLQELHPYADDYRISLAALAAAWTLTQPGCTHALLGIRSREQAVENARAGNVCLDPAVVEAMGMVFKRHFPDEKLV